MPEERIYVIPLGEVKKAPRHRRTMRAVKLVREFLRRHMKSEEIKLDQALNSKLWGRGAKHPLPRIRVRVVKQDDGSVQAFLAE
jgi:large subunit ribosomal protein L31e